MCYVRLCVFFPPLPPLPRDDFHTALFGTYLKGIYLEKGGFYTAYHLMFLKTLATGMHTVCLPVPSALQLCDTASEPVTGVRMTGGRADWRADWRLADRLLVHNPPCRAILLACTLYPRTHCPPLNPGACSLSVGRWWRVLVFLHPLPFSTRLGVVYGIVLYGSVM